MPTKLKTKAQRRKAIMAELAKPIEIIESEIDDVLDFLSDNNIRTPESIQHAIADEATGACGLHTIRIALAYKEVLENAG